MGPYLHAHKSDDATKTILLTGCRQHNKVSVAVRRTIVVVKKQKDMAATRATEAKAAEVKAAEVKAAEVKAAEAKAAAEKKKAQEAKDLFNVPAPAAATQQASGNSDQRAVSFSPPAILPPAPGQKPTILHRLFNMPEEKFKTKLFDILTEAKNGDVESQKELAKILKSTA